jgi:hypothetical protein
VRRCRHLPRSAPPGEPEVTVLMPAQTGFRRDAAKPRTRTAENLWQRADAN